MTAVLSPTDAFRRDMPSLSPDDDPYSTDWRQKYIELSETLAETRADLEEFQLSSKELEEEMTLEIERTERAQQEQKMKGARVEAERDEWKSKFVTLQTTHNTATTSLQRELDTLRQQQQTYKVQMRELEMGNDDLERNERAVMSNLADIETKYSRVLEEKILLEHELLDKANLEEESQRLKDELRDANEEISNLKRQLEARAATTSSTPPTPELEANDRPFPISPRCSLDDDLLRTPAPAELLLSDLTPDPVKAGESLPSPTPPPTPIPSSREAAKSGSAMGQSALLSRAGFPSTPASAIPLAANSPSSLPRSSTLPTLSPARTTNHTAHGQTFARPSTRAPSNLPVIPGTASKSKGVQMISALRSRVQTTHQRLIPGIPRLRMGSVNGRTGPPPQIPAVSSDSQNGTAQSDRTIRNVASDSVDERGKRLSGEKRRESLDEARSGAQSPGWVLIQTQDDSPMPGERRDPSKERRRASSPMTPTANGHAPIPSAFKPLASTSTRGGPPGGIPRRPQSRLSLTGSDDAAPPAGGSLFGSSSVHALPSRPSTPTFLPVPTFNHHGGPKRSTEGAPASFAASAYNPRRSSLGTRPAKRSVSPGPPLSASPHPMHMSTRERPTSVPAAPRTSFGSSHGVSNKNALNKSRIGKPPPGGRRSTGGSSDEVAGMPKTGLQKGRLRSGSKANT